MLLPIDSIDDPRLVLYRGIRDRELRGASGLFMAESARVVERLIESRYEVESVLVNHAAASALAESLSRLPERTPIHLLADGLETRLAGCRFHGGALAIGRRRRHPPALAPWLAERVASIARGGPLRLLLAEGVTHPDNLGAIFRNAACLGGHGVLLDGACSDPLLRQSIRFSMGRTLSVPWTVVESLGDAIDPLRAEGFAIVAAELDERALPLRCIPRPDRIALLVGSEGHGVSAALLDRCDAVVRIPGGDPLVAGSLNVAVASAILLYELVR
jgi:tRNA G18 (ribose-2'-O)-methylase SpoU